MKPKPPPETGQEGFRVLASVQTDPARLALKPRPDVEQTLAKLEQASALLQEVRTIQNAKQIHDLAKAARVYAREHDLGQEVVQRASALSFEALRHLGKLLSQTERAVGGQPYQSRSTGSGSEPVVPTLAELGITKKTSMRAQQLYALPSDVFEQIRDGQTTLDKVRATRPDLFGADWKNIWRGMPSYGHEDLRPCQTVLVHFRTDDDRRAFADLVGQTLSPKTKYIWYPKVEPRVAGKRWRTERVDPRYPIYVPTKGRWKTPQTIRALERMNVPYYAVVQPQEYEHYKQVVGNGKILVLPEGLDGLVPARNWIMEHSIRAGAKRHWQIDDNITGFARFQFNTKIDVTSGVIFRIIEDLSDRYTNVAISGPHYCMFAPTRSGAKIPPITLNTRVYSCSLINNDIPYRYRGVFNDDTDICLRALKDNWCVLLINAFLCRKTATMTLKGGNTPLYEGDGRLKMAESLKRQHPDCVTIVKKWGRWQHQVDYQKFRTNQLILRPGVIVPEGPNEYGLTLVAAPQDEPDRPEGSRETSWTQEGDADVRVTTL